MYLHLHNAFASSQTTASQYGPLLGKPHRWCSSPNALFQPAFSSSLQRICIKKQVLRTSLHDKTLAFVWFNLCNVFRRYTCAETAGNAGESGAGLFFNATQAPSASRTLTLANCTLRNNVASSSGGGIFAGSGLTSLTLEQLSVVNNSAYESGGALQLVGNSDGNITNCGFHYNSGTTTCMAQNL